MWPISSCVDQASILTASPPLMKVRRALRALFQSMRKASLAPISVRAWQSSPRSLHGIVPRTR